MSKTTIEWTDYTFNPWWGCFKVSEECKHCYAETLSKRFGNNIWGPSATTERRFFGTKHWNEPLQWNEQAQREGLRKRVFCASMADVYEDHPMVKSARHSLWILIQETPYLDWLLLTKRPENILSMSPAVWKWSGFPENVWIGTSVGTQKRVEERLPYLLQVPAHIRFLSCEPLLEPLDLRPFLRCCPSCGYPRKEREYDSCGYCEGYPEVRGVSWVIAGSESGHGARPAQVDWYRSLRDQCQAADVAFFLKQFAQNGHKIPLPALDGKIWNEFPSTSQEVNSIAL